MKNEDDLLGMNSRISRRDFINGVALSLASAASGKLMPAFAAQTNRIAFPQDQSTYYPPTLKGMRGSGAGSFEFAHKLRDGEIHEPFSNASADGTFDLVIVGAGISGLSAAYFFQKQNPQARILILDNHDDFGGHATRNEFQTGGRMLLINGGSADIESPFPFSKVAHGLMDELGIKPVELAKKCESDPYKDLDSAYFLDKETFGTDELIVGTPERKSTTKDWKAFLAKSHLPQQVQADIAGLHDSTKDLMPGVSGADKKDRLSRMSYKDFLLNVAKVDPAVIPFYQSDTHGLYGVGIDAVNALDCWALGFPGFSGMKLPEGPHPRMGYTARGFATKKEDYRFHFPDGNASIVRLLLRSLIPGMLSGSNVEDIANASCDYSKLDRSENKVRIKLSSTVVRVHQLDKSDHNKKNGAEVFYSRGGNIYSVKADAVIMACWNMLLPHVCPELPEAQKEALLYGSKVPIIYTSVAIKNWKSFQKLGIVDVNCPGMYHGAVALDRAVSIGKYHSPVSPDEPIVLRLTRTPCMPGLPEPAQHKVGRADLLSASFETFEEKIRDQLHRILGPGGFDPARDIDGITVNRWAHGFTYEYNYLFDPEWAPGQAPCEIARKRFGCIAIANADSAAAAYLDQAIDQAHRAVQDLINS